MQINNQLNENKKLSLKINFSWNFLGNIVFSFGQWAILAIMTKMVVVEEVGNFSYAIAFSAPFVLFFDMQLRLVQVTDTRDEYSFNDYFGYRIISSIISFILIICISMVIRNSIEMTILIASVTLMKLSDSISDILYGLFQKHEYMIYIATSKIIKSLLIIVFFSISLWFTRNIIFSTLLITIVKFLIIIFYDFVRAQKYTRIKPAYNRVVINKLFRTSLPLGVMSLLMSLDGNIPKYVVQHYEGLESLGYFSALSYINMAGGQMITAISHAATPRLATLYANGRKNSFIKLLIKLMMIGFVIGISAVLFILFFGHELISILYSEKYTQHMDVFLIIMVAGAINYTSSFLGNGMTAARAFKIQPWLGAIWVITSFVVSMLFVPKYGLIGGAITLMISSIVKLVSKVVVICRVIKYSNEKNCCIRRCVDENYKE